MKTSKIQRRYLPSHSTLRSFECAARYESFTMAAAELHLTQSAISRQIKEFEQLVGTDLFRRVGRRVFLTPAGRNLAKELAIDLENIHHTIMRAVSAGENNVTIRVATLPTFASNWLIPRLAEFTEKHDNIEVALSTRLAPFDMDREKFDLAIYYGNKDWPGTSMRVLCSESMIAVASPKLIEKYRFKTIKDLEKMPLLHLEGRPISWQSFFKQVNISHEAEVSGKYFDLFSMTISGAVSSLGAALVPTYLVGRELADGSLVALSEESITTENKYYLVMPENIHNEHVQQFCEWISHSVSQPVHLE